MAITGITTSLWFDQVAGEAVAFYVDLFPDSRILDTTTYGANDRYPEGTPVTISFELFGQPFLAINAGAEFSPTPAISFQVFCDTQQEINRLWDALTDGGREDMCGWCADRYGISWQIIPRDLPRLLSHPDADARQRVTAAMMGMRRLDLAALQAAAG